MNSNSSIVFPFLVESHCDDQTLLPIDFVPSSMDVICQRGRQAYNHSGNRRFRLTIAFNLKRYQEAPNKTFKSAIVNQIVDLIHENSRNEGGFVRFNKETNRWYEIGHILAREKVGFTLREELRKTDLVYMDMKRSKRREMKRQRDAERKRSSMETISAAIKRAATGLLFDEKVDCPIVVKTNAGPIDESVHNNMSICTSDDDDLEPISLAVPSEELEPIPLELPTEIKVSSVASRYPQLKSSYDRPREVVPVKHKIDLRETESGDWFSQDQMQRMPMVKEGDFSALFERDRSRSSSSSGYAQLA